MKFRMKGVDLAKVKQYILEHPDEFYYKTPIDELPELYLSGADEFLRRPLLKPEIQKVHWH